MKELKKKQELKPKVEHIVRSQLKAGVSPKVKDNDLQSAFDLYSKIQTGFNIGLEGREKVCSKEKTIARKHVLGKLFDKVLGRQTKTVTFTKTVGEPSYLVVELVDMVENVKNKVEQKHVEEARN